MYQQPTIPAFERSHDPALRHFARPGIQRGYRLRPCLACVQIHIGPLRLVATGALQRAGRQFAHAGRGLGGRRAVDHLQRLGRGCRGG